MTSGTDFYNYPKIAMVIFHGSTFPKCIPRVRHLWNWLNKSFNALDATRLKQFGPDRTCAEWILRNGGQVKFKSADEYLVDYNKLPPEGETFYIQEIDASGSSIAHYGFIHFHGCKHIEKIILHDCPYLLDTAFKDLRYIKSTLTFLQVSNCPNITSHGLYLLSPLKSLKTLVFFDLPSVQGDEDEVVRHLKSALPDCSIFFR